MSDETAVELIKAGRYEFLSVIIDRYKPLIVFNAKGIIPDDYIDDFVQETTFALYNAIQTYDLQKSSFCTYATNCIQYSRNNFTRRIGALKNIPADKIMDIESAEISDHSTPEAIIIEREAYDNLTQSIKLELSKMEFEVLQLFLSGLSYGEIAKNLNISEKKVDNALSRVRKKLRK